MKKIILLKGLPGSGKTTWCKTQCSDRVVRTNKDDLRAMLGGRFDKAKEKLVLKMRDEATIEALKQGKTVIVDDTNFSPAHEIRMKQIAEENGAGFQIKFFDTPVQECIERDAKRETPVGEEVIRDMWRTFIRPTEKINNVPKIEHDPALPNCIIVDIDGTLAHMQGRNPYDYTRVNEDVVDDIVRRIANHTCAGGRIKMIVVSGRKDNCESETSKWLMDNNISFNHLLMRKSEDDRPDWIVKKEIYEQYIKGKYNVLFVLDDRDQVVTMWREQGLKCLQVAEGNF